MSAAVYFATPSVKPREGEDGWAGWPADPQPVQRARGVGLYYEPQEERE